jgi:diguanylate cyclase (GGDEF)-like protein/PAS domain S-box-containing protein
MDEEARRDQRLLAAAGAALGIAALTVMGGWIFRSEQIVVAFPGYRMVFNTALGFLLAALALLCALLPDRLRAAAQTFLGGALVVFFAAILAQHLSGAAFGIDWPQLHSWLPGPEPTPGRSSAVSCAGFIAVGAALIVAQRANRRASAFTVHALTVGVAILGAGMLVGTLLDLGAMFDIPWFSGASPASGVGFLAAAAGLWLGWRNAPWNRPYLLRFEDIRITVSGAAIATAIAAAAGVSGMAIMRHSAERSLAESLAFAHRTRAILFEYDIAHRTTLVARIAARPDLVRAYRELMTDTRREENLAFLRTLAPLLLREGLSYVEFRDPRGVRLASEGQAAQGAEFFTPLAAGPSRALIWDGRLVLRVERPIYDGDATRGFVVGEQPLPDVERVILDVSDISTSAEAGVCAALSESAIICLPLRFNPRVARYERRMRGLPLPMSYALDGRRGVMRTRDYRNREVLVAYGPIGDLGLGLVVKVDAAELYAVVRKNLLIALPFLIVMIAAGAYLVYSHVHPLTRRLARSERQLKAALAGSRMALWDWDVPSGRVYLSERWREMLGAPPAASATSISELQALVHPEDLPVLRQHLRDVLDGTATYYDFEHRVKTFSGDWIWIRSRGTVGERDAHGRPARLIGTNVDITRRKRAELLLEHQAGHDALTGLPNRRLFHDRLTRAMARSRRHGSLMALLYLDIDRFKHVNDTLGHDAGDTLLKTFSKRLTECVRETDTVARLGGDEFTVILEELNGREDGCQIAQKIVAAMRPEFVLEGRSVNVSTSVGIAFYHGEEGVAADDLIKKADAALYQAKAAGRDQYRIAA